MTSPYLLPAGHVQIGVSAGRTSGMMARMLQEANGGLPEDRVALSFQNTSREMNESLDFLADMESRWGLPITWLEYRPKTPLEDWQIAAVAEAFGEPYAARLVEWWEPSPLGFAAINHGSAARDGEVFVALILSRRFLPNVLSRFCTAEMKLRVLKRWLMSRGWDRWTACAGIRADEPHRLNKPQPKERWTVWHPLAEAGVTRRDVVAFWERQPFDLRLPNVNGKCWLGNCDGCFLKSERNIAALTREYPERAAWWERAEHLATLLSRARGMTPGRGAWFSKRYTRRELREFMNRNGELALSTEGLLCQATDGECFG